MNALNIVQNQAIGLMPSNMAELERFANIVAGSTLAPKDYKNQPGNIMIAVMMGAELGLKPMQCLAGISVINGKAVVWGDTLLALCRASGLMEVFHESYNEEDESYTCTTKRKGFAETSFKFSRKDAEVAGLWGRNTWKNYPKRMLQMRARAFLLRDTYTDILKGLQSAEEQRDIVETIKIDPQTNTPAPPKPKTKPKMTAKDLLNKPKEEPKAIEEPEVKDKKTLFDHHQFAAIREYWDSDPDRLMIMTKKRNLNEISEIPIKFFDVIISAMEKESI